MGFAINCNNRGCNKMQEPLLDTRDNKVYCSDCNKEINNVSSFAKTQMKSLGQVKRPDKALAIECQSCHKAGTPALEKDKLVCSWCGKDHTKISKSFEIIIRDFIKKGGS